MNNRERIEELGLEIARLRALDQRAQARLVKLQNLVGYTAPATVIEGEQKNIDRIQALLEEKLDQKARLEEGE